MSIKKLFDGDVDNRNYLSSTDQKEAFAEVESERNLEQINTKKDQFRPQIDYSNPANFAKFGSAKLYYQAAMERITDYYPYDGSDAEINEFYNKLLDIEKYIFDDLYPRRTGYVKLAESTGTGSSTVDTYSLPTTEEFVTLKGGPHAVSGDASLVSASNNPYSDKFQHSNVYEADVYTSAGLPSDYGSGTRESNLQSDFEKGVTVEFWLKKPEFKAPGLSNQLGNEAIFDLWTSGSLTGSSDYGRITVELSPDGSSPLQLTVQSGGVGFQRQLIGQDLSTTTMATWNHYSIVLFNSGSNFIQKLYVNGGLNDTNTLSPTTATATITISDAGGISHGDTFTLIDSTGVSTIYTINGGVAAASGGGSGGSATVGFLGVGGGSAGKIAGAAAMVIAINATSDANYTSVSNGVDAVTITQGTTGSAGNKTNTDSIGYTTVTNFTGGLDRSMGELKQSGLHGRLGALLTAPASASIGSEHLLAGGAKLSASMDEFRFWKTARNGQEIGRNWLSQVRGGTNTDIANTTLGIYYKFNEGIVGESSTDSTVLDYSGRLSNGIWTGYAQAGRSTGSAILEASASIKEYADPVIYSAHPSVSTLKSELMASGSEHDNGNSGMFLYNTPSWILEEHENQNNNNLSYITHIMGSYFDKIYLLSQALPSLKSPSYTSSSAKPVPFAQHLPQSLGLTTPELFVDATVLEKIMNRTETDVFENDLSDTKNLIYLNLYNNLANIYKAKGTEKSLRNVLRCFNVDEKIVKVNTYLNNAPYDLETKYEQVTENRKYANFDKESNRSAVIYQSVSASALTDNLRGFIGTASGGTYEREYGLTVEAEVRFPYWNNKSYVVAPRDYTTVSLFGLRRPADTVTSLSGSDTSVHTADNCNFSVRAEKTANSSKDAYFTLSSSVAGFPTLTSSVFPNVYDNNTWNFSVRLESDVDAPTHALNSSAIGEYSVIFEGKSVNTGLLENSFVLSGSLATTEGNNFLASNKRAYIGAERTNITGAIENYSDVLIGSAKYWAKSLTDASIKQHAYDKENYGIKSRNKNVSPIDSDNAGADVVNESTLALNWVFNQVTASNVSGLFALSDNSSGSYSMRTDYGAMGTITGYQHTGLGYGFAASDSSAVSKQITNAYKFISPERATSADAIRILQEKEKIFGTTSTIPNYVYTVEKSLYRAISEEMLDFMAGAVDFNELIGAPVNRYRKDYKALGKLRETFFRRVTETSQVEKFVEYYKWFDDAISHVIEQLAPVSSDFISDVLDVVEGHVFERNKYQTQYPTLETKVPDPTTNIVTFGDSDFSMGTTTLAQSPRPTNKHIEFWKTRAIRSSEEITSGDSTIDSQRETFRKIINSAPRFETPKEQVVDGSGNRYSPNEYAKRNFQKLYKLKQPEIKNLNFRAGVNFETPRNIHLTYNSLYPFGPVNTGDDTFIPLNVLLGLTDDLVSMQDFLDDREIRGKVKRTIKIQSGRDWEKGIGYHNLKSNTVFPFNIMSSSVNTGFNKEVVQAVGANVEITNLHNDVYGNDMEKPLQGPFTEKYVGGHQSRHVGLNTGTDNNQTRPEAWKLVIGECADQGPGSIGMTSVTYPYPDIGAEPSASTGLITLSSNVSAGDYAEINDGDAAYRFEVPFENEYSTLFPDSTTWQVKPVAISGDLSASYGLPSDHPLDYYHLPEATISTWVSASSTTSNAYLFAMGVPHATISLGLRSDNTLRLEQIWYDGDESPTVNVTAHWSTDDPVITDGKWHHVAVTYNAALTASQEPKFFVDGVLKDSTVGTAPPTDVGSTLQISRKANGLLGASSRVITTIGGYNHNVAFSGSIDETSIWQISMSAEQITEMYATGSVKNLFGHSSYIADNANLYSWWRMGDDANDAINGGGSYSLGVNSIVDQTSRANGNPGATQLLSTNVVTASAPAGSSIAWTKGASSIASATNLSTAINDSAASLLSSPALATVSISNTKYGVPTSTKKSARGSLGNVAVTVSGSLTATGMAGGLDPVIINANTPRATYYREELAKRPVNIRNILHTTGSTIIGNYNHNYDVVSTVGAFSNPKAFIENTPALPAVITSQTNLNRAGADHFEGTETDQVVNNYLTLNRDSGSHFDYGLDYEITDFAEHVNKSVIISRFSSPGSRETLARGTQNFRSGEYSAYNSLPYRNMGVLNAGQSNESLAETGSTGYTVSDIHNRPFGLKQHLTRHAGQFGRDSMIVTGTTATTNGPGAEYDQLPSFSKTNRNPRTKIAINAAGDYITSSHYDNYYVSRQIPRSDSQYKWIADALIDNNNNFGYLPADYLVSSSAGYTEPYTFISSSEGEAQWPTGTVDWGYPSWKQVDYNNSLTRTEKKNNTISIIDNTQPQGTSSYTLSPVSYRGRPAKINISLANGKSTTLVATDNNSRIYFQDNEMNDATDIKTKIKQVVTPFKKLIDATINSETSRPNWILYSQNIFPSEINEFKSDTITRTGYNNEFWSKTIEERILEGSQRDNSFGIPLDNIMMPDYSAAAAKTYPTGMQLTQSSWPLDAPENFLTRTGSNPWSDNAGPTLLDWNFLRGASGSAAGELQNNYVLAALKPASILFMKGYGFLSPGALYSRKQTLSSPNSVVSPVGITLPATGSLSSSFDVDEQIEAYAGEAMWDAPTYAGYDQRSGSTTTFVSHSSEPWFTEYSKFKEDLSLKARDFSIVPEFRISEHVSDFTEKGIIPQDKTDYFEIPGTGIDSSNSDSFYLDYSNSEFLKDFLKVKSDSLMDAKEIRLSCEAAIRFNPYKGFYPAQRTIDMVSQWSSSYADSLSARITPQSLTSPAEASGSTGQELLQLYGGAIRPVIAPLFAPGILYNSIKAGIAVDYPIITDFDKVVKWPFISSSIDSGLVHDNSFTYALTIDPRELKSSAQDPNGYDGGPIWDKRVPFEAIIRPEIEMGNLALLDLESNASSSLRVTASMGSKPSNGLYSLMASNYFAEVGNFFLKDSEYTKLESAPISDKLTFKSGSTFAARIKLRRSTTGLRDYSQEIDSNGHMYISNHLQCFFRPNGGISTYRSGSLLDEILMPSGAYFPLPQDPRFTSGPQSVPAQATQNGANRFRETFTMYSRPSAFGPPVASSRIIGPNPSDSDSTLVAGIVNGRTEEANERPPDSFNGYNWSFTPPYYDGESWADVIFRPEADKTYSVEEILANVDICYWRYDGGGHGRRGKEGTISTTYVETDCIGAAKLGFTGSYASASYSGSYIGAQGGIYDADTINQNAMQISASINLLGFEKVQSTEKDKFGDVIATKNTTAGTRWVIQPKFETPHLNFNEAYEQAQVPVYGSASVPIGMWHQFGKIPTDLNTGIFLEIDDIPEQWQKYHYDMYKSDSIYNNFNAAGFGAQGSFKSLSDIFGFKTQARRTRLGEIREKQVLKEAIVAVPYVLENVKSRGAEQKESTRQVKKFVSIPKDRYIAATKEMSNTAIGDSSDAAGASIRALVNKMDDYVLPPQFDFLNNKEIDPMVMYMFEFKYALDKDDLSYIWQNLAPRDYKKLSFQKSSVAHELMDTELLSESNIMDNPNLRWMIFKVKQRSQSSYEDSVVPQAGQAPKDKFLQTSGESNYKVEYNWPYDYVSFVEMVKIDAEVLFKPSGKTSKDE